MALTSTRPTAGKKTVALHEKSKEVELQAKEAEAAATPARHKFTAYFGPELHERLRSLAFEKQCSHNSLVLFLLEHALKRVDMGELDVPPKLGYGRDK